MKTISISEIRFYEDSRDKIPVAILVDETGKAVGYLAPFRAYAFQVSSTFEGTGCLGSSEVFGLKNVIHSASGSVIKNPENRKGYQSNMSWTETTEMLLRGAALIAIQDFAERNDAAIQLSDGKYDENRVLSNGRYLRNFLPSKLDQFIMETINWLAPDVCKPLTKEFA
ncbi:MAG: hypothetical protein NC548_05640 [Lachnospiraceae bacterium]|nr:hypothetical protein [Lachnospiraceae bacterium]